MISGFFLFFKDKFQKCLPGADFLYFNFLAFQPFCSLIVQNCILNKDFHDIRSFP